MTRARTISATRRGLSALLGAVLVAGLTALAAPPATSATPWLPEVEATAAPADEIRQTATATGPDGTFVMAWVENLDGNDRSWTVQVATRAPGAAGFSTPVEAAPPGSNVRRLVLVVDATGATTVVWNRRVEVGIYGLEVAHRAAGAAGFAAPETLSSSVAEFSGVGDDQGRVTVAWTRSVLNPEGQVVTTVAETATWEPDLADWSAPTLLDVGHLGPPDLAVDGAGVVTMAWVERMDAQSLLRTRRRPVGSTLFEIAQTPLVAGSSFATNPDVASNAAGDTVVVWGLGTGFDGLMQVAVRSAGAVSFGDPIDVATAAHVEAPLVAIDGAGTATVAWSEVTDVARVWVATALAGGAFTPPVQVDSGGDRAVALTLSGSAAGASVLAWIYRWDASGSRVARAAYRPAGGSFGATIDLTERVVGVLDDEVAASIDPDGSAFVAWARRTLAEGFLYRAYARVLDGRGPVLPAVAVPATGTAGSAVAMSAPASDLWSGPPTITWNFGDGGTGAGASTRTCTPRPGPTPSG